MVRAGEPGGFSGFRPVLATQKQPTRISPFVLDGAADPRHVVRDHTCRWVRQLPGAVLVDPVNVVALGPEDRDCHGQLCI